MTTLTELKQEVDSLKEDLAEIKRDTSELLVAWKDAKGALKALAWVGTAAKWITTVGGAGAFLYFTFTGKK